MKLVVAIVVLIAVCAGGYFYFRGEAQKDTGVLIGYGFPKSENGKTEVHVEVRDVLFKSEPPTGWPANQSGVRAWAESHFEIHDADGKTVPVSYMNDSKVGAEHRGGNTLCFIRGEVEVGKSYTISFIPVSGQDKRYNLTVTVPAALQYVKLVYFLPTEGK